MPSLIMPISLLSSTIVGIVLKFSLKLCRAPTSRSHMKGLSFGGKFLIYSRGAKQVLSYKCNDKRKILICFCIESLEKLLLKLKTELFWWRFYIDCIGFIDVKLCPIFLLYPLNLIEALIALSCSYLWMMTLRFWKIL